MTTYKLGFRAEALFSAGDEWGASQHFPKDYMTSILVALNLYSVRWLEFSWPDWLRRAVVGGAAFTFTLYLIHYPIIGLMERSELRRTAVGFVLTLLLVAIATYAIGTLTETRRHQLRVWMARSALAVRAGGVNRNSGQK